MINIKAKILLSHILITISILVSCAQSKSTKSVGSEETSMVADTISNKVYAFYVEIMPGNIPVGIDGEELPGSKSRIYYTLYIETEEDNIIWQKATREGEEFTIRSTLIKEQEVEVGKDKLNEDPVVIKKSKGKHLWKLELDAVKSDNINLISINDKGFILFWKTNGKSFEKLTHPPVELYTHPSV